MQDVVHLLLMIFSIQNNYGITIVSFKDDHRF